VKLPLIRTIEKREPMLAITPMGQQKAESFQGGGIEFRALAVLHDEGPTSVKDLGQRLGVDDTKARLVARSLISRRWANTVD